MAVGSVAYALVRAVEAQQAESPVPPTPAAAGGGGAGSGGGGDGGNGGDGGDGEGDGDGKGERAVHGNSKESMKPNHRYEVVETKTGDVVKTGVSGQPLNANGTSPRANPQVRALNNSEGAGTYSSRVVESNLPGRRAALQAEQAATNRLKADGNSLRLQQRPKPQ
jgi:hypothetical protein